MKQSTALNFCIFNSFFQICCASLNFTNQKYDIQVGVPFTLKWMEAQGAVTLGLFYKNTSSSQENIYIIATGITESQFVWTPPDLISGILEQNIAAQDDKNLTFTGNVTISKATATVASTAFPSSTTKSATTQPSSANSVLPDDRTTTQTKLSSAAKARIGFSICIVVILIIIGVALISFEHGKRAAARTELWQPKSPLERADSGSMDLELAEINLTTRDNQDEEAVKEIMEEPSTPLLYQTPNLAVELEAGVMNNLKADPANKSDEGKKKRILSTRSIFELG